MKIVKSLFNKITLNLVYGLDAASEVTTNLDQVVLIYVNHDVFNGGLGIVRPLACLPNDITNMVISGFRLEELYMNMLRVT